MMYEYQGMVEEVGPVQTIGTNGFTKRDLIVDNDIDSDNRYPNPVKFSFKRMNCALLDPIQKGMRVKVRFAIDGRRWDGGTRGTQYFVDLTGVKIDVIGADGNVVAPGAPASAVPGVAAPVAGAPVPPPAAPASSDTTGEFVDDVPF